ncbi:heterogeneous nuclear ribonucleoprotein R isoform X1 [Phlebotomus papatasi]|uniref:heterogeneous nuclear ribonucleoprotein R isoform X1 n=1 Tax=Phlebotomus papatasi TaxID=29031 RepID=UPI002483FF6F|nr:heterogeneous nuclear ribonucleoprotein R isoform X1 [Phlebotomus papatasi]XP_055698325.1 heterogeneous nuclear ribonucleoprotein R isoform X1 [Phlebotomus papatasi]XP_055698333.1 heterogeneous nuclear ribonucleoprotein R isoform X1 [Phlebotomus papatasi]XP_055698558.1 heterogeneous nuclear ribonucleoprotein R isoform X1 [Phlebotomus papatasi]
MAEGNGEVVDDIPGTKSEDRGDGERTEDYSKLLEYGLDKRVASKLDDIYKTGKLAHVELDERALDALKEFPVDGALNVLSQFLESNLEHVSNKSAYLCGVMKTYRQKSRASQQGVPAPTTTVQAKGPDEEKIKQILERTGYTLDVTTGQRKYGGPPPNWDGPTPGNGCEVFCGKIPKDMYEDELIPLFEKCGPIWDLRLMMDPMTGTNRGYAFVTFTTRDSAQNAVKELNDYEIRKGKKIGVTISFNNHRLFVGNIPKNRDRDELLEEFSKYAPGLVEVIIYSSPDDKKKNRGFCFLEYESHKAASLAKRRLGTGRIKVWGCDIIVDWADPQEEPDEQTMSKVKVLYVRNLTQDISEEKLKEQFEQFGKVERVKKIKDYAFVHFEDRDNAVLAMRDLDGKELGGSNIEVSLAKPPSDKKKKEEILRARERRMLQMMQGRVGITGDEDFRMSPSHPSMMAGMPPMRGVSSCPRIPLRGPMGRGDYDYDYDFYGYSDYRGGYSEPYYDDYYRSYDGDYYYDYSPSGVAPAAGGPPRTSRSDSGGGHGRGITARGRAAGLRGNTNRQGAPPVQRGATVGAQATAGGVRGAGQTRLNARGTQRGKPQQNLPGEEDAVGKRKFDGGHQNQGDPKRRYGSGIGNGGPGNGGNWGSQPLPQQPLGANGEQWYTDTYPSWS